MSENEKIAILGAGALAAFFLFRKKGNQKQLTEPVKQTLPSQQPAPVKPAPVKPAPAKPAPISRQVQNKDFFAMPSKGSKSIKPKTVLSRPKPRPKPRPGFEPFPTPKGVIKLKPSFKSAPAPKKSFGAFWKRKLKPKARALQKRRPFSNNSLQNAYIL